MKLQKNFLDLQTYTNKIKVRREQHYIVLSRVLSNKLSLQMSTQNYICLRQLIPVAVKLVK